MATQRYSVTPYPIETLLTWVKSGEIAIPEIQRPFVWTPSKVRDLLDSLYRGYPIGYLIAWRNPTVKLKDGSLSAGKRILIDGQQRITALMAALLGKQVMTKNYDNIHIRISFHPEEKKFEVCNPAIAKDGAWIEDISILFVPDASLLRVIDEYTMRNPNADREKIGSTLEEIKKILNNHVGVIELNEKLDIETVTEIFIRVNSAGVDLSQADFAMSKIAVNEKFGGNELRKAIDYFCHFATAPEQISVIEQKDIPFTESEFWPQMKWLKNANDNIYDPKYTDMLRVAFTSEFDRGQLEHLVALISGRNFETREYEESIMEQSLIRLKRGILAFMNQTNFERFTMILRSAGFLNSSLIRSHNAVNFAYILYLCARRQSLSTAEIEQTVRRWYVMSILTGRFSASIDSIFDSDIRQIKSQGVAPYTKLIIDNELPDGFWTGILPQKMVSSSPQSPAFIAYQSAQVYLSDKGFLSTDIIVRDLLLNRGDKHHIFPRKYLQKKGYKSGLYNQIANLVISQSEINISIGDKSPGQYFDELLEQCNGGAKRYGGITDEATLIENLDTHCIPTSMLDDNKPEYEDFLEERRELMSIKIKHWFEKL